MTEDQKKAEIVRYYRAFSIGLHVAADVAVTVRPELAPAVSVAKASIDALDSSVNAYAQSLVDAQTVYGAAQVANAAVDVVAVKDDGLQSFFDSSTLRMACRGTTCGEMIRFGTNRRCLEASA
jgi:hypothetical protein